MKSHGAQQPPVAEIADFLSAVDEVADLLITDDEVEARLRGLTEVRSASPNADETTPIAVAVRVVHDFRNPAGHRSVSVLISVSAERGSHGVAPALNADVSLRLRTMQGVLVMSVEEWYPGVSRLTARRLTRRAKSSSSRTGEYPAGRREGELRQFRVLFEVLPHVFGDNMTVATVRVLADGSASGKRLVRVVPVGGARPKTPDRPPPLPRGGVDTTMRMLTNLVGNPGAATGTVGSGPNSSPVVPGSSPVVPGLAAFGDFTIRNSTEGNRP